MADHREKDVQKPPKLYTLEQVCQHLNTDGIAANEWQHVDKEKKNAGKIANYLINGSSSFHQKISSSEDEVIILRCGHSKKSKESKPGADTKILMSFNCFRFHLHSALSNLAHIRSLNAYYSPPRTKATNPVDLTLPYRTLIYDLITSEPAFKSFPDWAMQEKYCDSLFAMLEGLSDHDFNGVLFITIHGLRMYQLEDDDMADSLLDLRSLLQGQRFSRRKFKVKILYLPCLAEDTKGRFSEDDFITVPPFDLLKEHEDNEDENKGEELDRDEILDELTENLADMVYDPTAQAEEYEPNLISMESLTLQNLGGMLNLDPDSVKNIYRKLQEQQQHQQGSSKP